MQSGGGVQHGGGGHGRNTVAGPPSSSASPSSSSSAVSTPQLGFDPMQQQQQQQRQSLQHQLLRNPEARESMLAYQSGNLQGVLGGNVAQMQGQNRNQGFDQNMMNPVHQAYSQYAFQNQQKPGLGMQPQQQIRMGTVVPSSKDPKMPDSDQGQSQNQKQFVTPTSLGQLMQGNSSIRPMSAPQGPQNMTMAAQLQAMQALALERNIDLSLPQNANLVAQLIPLMQARMQKANETNMTNENSPRGNPSSDVGSTKTHQNIPPGHLGSTSNPLLVNNSGPGQGGQVQGQDGQSQVQGPGPGLGHGQQLPPRQPAPVNSGVSSMHLPQASMNMNQGSMQQMNRSSSQQKLPSAFTKQQLHVLKAQILAFRRIKKGEKTLPSELIQAIAPPPLEAQTQQSTAPAGTINVKSQSQPDDQIRRLDSNDKDQAAAFTSGMNSIKREGHEDNAATVSAQGTTSTQKETPLVLPAKPEQEVELGVQKTSNVTDGPIDKGKSVISEPVTVPDNAQSKRPLQAGNPPQTKDSGPKKYHGPLFDFPFFTRKHDAFGSSMMINNNNNLTLAYDLKDLISEEGIEVINKKRRENIEKINSLLAVNLERRRIRPDLVLRLQIEEKKLKLQNLQKRVRDEVDQQQQDIMAMPDRPYRKFIRLCERQRVELNRQVQASQRAIREKQLKLIFQWRKKLLECHWAIRDARTQRNRGVAKYHEKMLREFSKRKDDDRSKRMEALKNNDVERYREILLEQQTSMPGEAAERYEVLSSFLSQTEDYLHKLGSKITAAKNQQEVEEAANGAAAAARAQGLSEEEVRAAASCAREEVSIRNRFSEMNAPQDSSSVSKYYTLAHAVNERVIRQPSMLRCGTLRDYQLVGLQWMLSLYNNKLNGILADEMGLGKTVQVMALIAYLMEFKSNYGPHLIIVPNAVLVNWKSELHSWLPNVSCIYYVGNKDQRTKLFSQEVCHMKFNVLVTTYEFVMYDRSKLSRVDWKYIVIDEAQRMKDRESVLARDLDKYRCQRRLLLTGTPLQNDLKELWSLLNLLLPEVFDNRKAFHDWFSKPFSKEVAHSGEDDWLETEKKVIIIHRLHQILEPFMLRRRVEDVEGSLPPKISVILRCKMSAFQGAVTGFDQRTTHEERRSTLESLLRDEERYQETVHDVPSLQEVNRMIARSEEEVELFDQMDEEFDWADEMTRYDQVPKWLRAGTREVNTTVARLSKKPSKHMIFTENIENDVTDRRRGRYKDKKFPNYAELDDDIEEFSEATSEEVEDDETVDANETPQTDKAQSEDDYPVSNNRYEYPRGPNATKLKEEGSSGSSSDSQKVMPIATPSISSQKFGSLSALEGRPGSRSRRLHDDLEEGEIAFSGDSHLEIKQSSSGTRHHDEVEDEQVLQPKIKRKRSIRLRPKQEKPSLLHGGTSHLPFQADRNKMQVKTETEQKVMIDQTHPSLKPKKTPPPRKNSNKANVDVAVRTTRGNSIAAPPKDTSEHPKESGIKMSEAIQRRCKNVITKIQRRIDKEGQQIIPLLTDLWKRSESHGNNILDLHKIELRVDRLNYNTVPDLIVDVQAMLKSGMQFFGFSHEVRSEARKVHDLMNQGR
ncbi:hypothetical protein L1987_28631 [Smallanthus sonchifolius]|uniref:Uncharacterized protein n=1 Tax=Smallanthus sonchifolius TaxID=185202 RepID=A0ACB9HZJ5_9ASTR|nr:hypothetical protein L1987_28631 [Smallanthus sonchifolius]